MGAAPVSRGMTLLDLALVERGHSVRRLLEEVVVRPLPPARPGLLGEERVGRSLHGREGGAHLLHDAEGDEQPEGEDVGVVHVLEQVLDGLVVTIALDVERLATGAVLQLFLAGLHRVLHQLAQRPGDGAGRLLAVAGAGAAGERGVERQHAGELPQPVAALDAVEKRAHDEHEEAGEPLGDGAEHRFSSRN